MHGCDVCPPCMRDRAARFDLEHNQEVVDCRAKEMCTPRCGAVRCGDLDSGVPPATLRVAKDI